MIMMTAVYRGWRFAQDARDAYGAEDYIEKPFRLDDVVRRIDAVLEATATRGPAKPSGGGPHDPAGQGAPARRPARGRRGRAPRRPSRPIPSPPRPTTSWPGRCGPRASTSAP